MSPHMPQTGEQIFYVCIRQGQLEVSNAGTVVDRNRLLISNDEFATTLGSRHHMKYFWPGGEPVGSNPERWPSDSLWIYTTSNGKLGAVARLKDDYIRACIKAEEALQERARALHEYASRAQQIKL